LVGNPSEEHEGGPGYQRGAEEEGAIEGSGPEAKGEARRNRSKTTHKSKDCCGQGRAKAES